MATIINGDGIVTVEGTSTTQGRVRLNEDTDNGTNYVELQAPASVPSTVTFTLPSADGTNGQIIQTNGSGVLTFANAASLATPLTVTGNSTAGAEIRLPEDTDNGSNYVALKAADNLASNVTFTLPSADGTNGQVLQTNASGTLSFANLAVANGGTGQTSLTSNNVILGNGTSAVQFVAPGTSGNVLTSDGTTWTSGTTSVAGGGTGRTTLTSNNVILGNGTSAVNFVAPGTNGNVLTSNGTTWQSTAPAGGGSWIFLNSVTASSSSSLNFTSNITSTYAVYAFQLVNVYPSSSENLIMQFSTNGGSSYNAVSGDYRWAATQVNPGGTSTSGNSSSASFISLTPILTIQNGTYYPGVSGWVYLIDPSATSVYSQVIYDLVKADANIVRWTGAASSNYTPSSAINAVRFLFNNGVTTTSGTIRMYGIKNS